MRKNLNEIVVTKTKAPEVGQLDIFDLTLPGFGLRLSAKGARTYFLMYRTAEQYQRRMKIGSARPPLGISLGEARKRAIEALRLLEDGIDPQSMPEPEPEKETFRDVVARYLRQHVGDLRPRTAEGVHRTFEKHALPAWESDKSTR
jgi:hypothetical protein